MRSASKSDHNLSFCHKQIIRKGSPCSDTMGNQRATEPSSADPPKVIIFDWDDTICPSSFFDRQQIEKMDELAPRYHKLFADIARCAEKCLHEASKYGEVIIITNSDDGWVKYSCERIVPALLPVIEKYRIVSARTGYEKFYPGQPLCWKAAAFAHEVNELFQDYCPNLEISDVSSEESFDMSSTTTTPTTTKRSAGEREIISFGDSMEERTAVRIVADQLNATPKSVMFVPSPTPTQIIGQLQMLRNQMKFVCEHGSSLDLEISPEQAERSAESYMRRNKVDRNVCEDLRELVSDAAANSPRRVAPLRL